MELRVTLATESPVLDHPRAGTGSGVEIRAQAGGLEDEDVDGVGKIFGAPIFVSGKRNSLVNPLCASRQRHESAEMPVEPRCPESPLDDGGGVVSEDLAAVLCLQLLQHRRFLPPLAHNCGVEWLTLLPEHMRRLTTKVLLKHCRIRDGNDHSVELAQGIKTKLSLRSKKKRRCCDFPTMTTTTATTNTRARRFKQKAVTAAATTSQTL